MCDVEKFAVEAVSASAGEREQQVGSGADGPGGGIVSSHAQTMRVATPQRTADSRLVDPTPTIAPVMACVVLTGMLKCVAVNSATARARLGSEPANWLQLRDFRAHRVDDAPAAGERAEPNRGVRGHLHPQRDVKRGDVARAEEHGGMIPAVFCASLPPWLRLKNAADKSCSRRNQLSTRPGGMYRSSQ